MSWNFDSHFYVIRIINRFNCIIASVTVWEILTQWQWVYDHDNPKCVNICIALTWKILIKLCNNVTKAERLWNVQNCVTWSHWWHHNRNKENFINVNVNPLWNGYQALSAHRASNVIRPLMVFSHHECSAGAGSHISLENFYFKPTHDKSDTCG